MRSNAFYKKKAKIIQIYKINKFYTYHLIKANLDLDIKLKAFISSNCFYVTNFISNINSSYFYIINFLSKKAKSDV